MGAVLRLFTSHLPTRPNLFTSSATYPLILYKILFHFKALSSESIILLLPHSTCKAYPIALLLHDHWAIYAPITTPPPPLCHTHTILVMAISCKGQAPHRYQVANKAAFERILIRLAADGDPTGGMREALELSEERRRKGESELPWEAFREVRPTDRSTDLSI